jgi:hypothetical protein
MVEAQQKFFGQHGLVEILIPANSVETWFSTNNLPRCGKAANLD